MYFISLLSFSIYILYHESLFVDKGFVLTDHVIKNSNVIVWRTGNTCLKDCGQRLKHNFGNFSEDTLVLLLCLKILVLWPHDLWVDECNYSYWYRVPHTHSTPHLQFRHTYILTWTGVDSWQDKHTKLVNKLWHLLHHKMVDWKHRLFEDAKTKTKLYSSYNRYAKAM